MSEYGWIPEGYYLDESEPEMLVLRRNDGLRLAFFPPGRVTKIRVLETIVKDKEWTEIFEGEG